MKKLQFFLWIVIAIAILVLIGGCVYSFVRAKTQEILHPEVTFEIENYGTVKMELYPEYAPNTVANIIKLVEKGYYNNKVVYGKDDMCLYVGRDAEGEYVNPTKSVIFDDVESGSEEDYEYSIKGEFVANDFRQNTLRHERGVITLIRSNFGTGFTEESYNSGNSQIGVMIDGKVENLNGVYAAFGRVTEGLEILEKIFNESEIAVDTEQNPEETSVTTEEAESTIQKFANKPVITSAKVDTHGIDYGMPEVQEVFDYNQYMLNLIQSYSD